MYFLEKPLKRLVPPSPTRSRCLFYDPVFVDVHSWDYNEEVALRENNKRALECFKEKYKEKIIKKEY